MIHRHYCSFIKGKDLETDANVSIKKIDDNSEVNILKDISNKTIKIKKIYNVKGKTYIVEDYFEGDLEYYRNIRCQNQNMSPNLIKKNYLCN